MQINHMHKALVQMNIQIGQAVSDISGVTGMNIIRAIVRGEHDPLVLAKYRDPRCKSSEAEIAKSLEGSYKSEHLLALKHALDIYDLLKEKIRECEEALEKKLSELITAQSEPATSSTEALNTNGSSVTSKKKTKKAPTKRAYHFDIAVYLLRYVGVDLTTIPGISEHTAMTIIAEIGYDMSRWGSAKQFASWLGLCPANDISGGKVLSTGTKKTNNKLAQALRMAAITLRHSKTALGAYFRRLASRIGLHKAITAVAHKLAVYIYCMLRDKKNYNEIGGETYERRYQDRVVSSMKKRASDLGYVLVKRDEQSYDCSLAAQ
jgi:transposase